MTVAPIGAPDFVPATIDTPADTLVAEQVSVTAGPLGFGPTLNATITAPSYLIALDCAISGAATKGIATVEVTWVDPATGVLLDAQTWNVPVHAGTVATTTLLVTGRGPTLASECQVAIFNNDPAQTMTFTCYLYQSSRVTTRHDWRVIEASYSVPGFTTAAQDPAGLLLGYFPATSLGAGSSQTELVGLFSGQALLMFSQSGTVNLQVTITPEDLTQSAPPLIYNNITAAGTVNATVTLPRSVCTVNIRNAGSTSVTVDWTLTAQEFAT